MSTKRFTFDYSFKYIGTKVNLYYYFLTIRGMIKSGRSIERRWQALTASCA